MQATQLPQCFDRFGWRTVSLCAIAFLTACGGGTGTGTAEPETPVAALASGTTVFEMESDRLPEEVGALVLQPVYRVAPVVLQEPEDEDTSVQQMSAQPAPRRLAAANNPEGMAIAAVPDSVATPFATGSAVSIYSPAQIRAAYGLPALPPSGTALTPAQAAQLGAGQTIYIVNAKHNPNVAAELNAFNQKFGLPTCTTLNIPVASALPLAAAPVNGCQLAVVYSNAAGGMTSVAPPYDAGWATEISLDVQWAHATAPMARIVLIEAFDASLNSLTGAIKLANAMGPGAVSMSFGTLEGSWTASVDSIFSASNMTYLAATGDSGAAVSWPAVSTKVVAVGGTSLTYTGTGPRSETAWSMAGGGTSLYTPRPAYQAAGVPGMGAYSGRSVADVSFNADPATGQYVAVMTPGSSAVKWISVGGTSLAAPQWAGLVAIANAMRATSAKAALGAPHAVLYSQIASVPGTYASAFKDITSGLNGSCAVCVSKIGFDAPSGLGTPNVANLLTVLTGATVPAVAPVVASARITGQAMTPLTFTASVTSSNAVTLSLSGAPAGMSINASGIVSWSAPVAGTYNVTVTAKDSKTGLSGSGVYTVVISAPPPPVVGSATINGKVGTALSFTASATSANPLTLTLSGAPAGMSMTAAGVVSWPSPVLGTYAVKVTAKDSKTGLSATGTYTVVIAAQTPPVVTPATINGKPGAALSFTPAVVAANPLVYSLSGAPAGMTIGSNGVVRWSSPVLGTYNVTVQVRDSKTGLTGSAVFVIKIASAGPVITAPATSGVVGKALSGTITISDPNAAWLSISISGVPLGMTLSAVGQTIYYNWASPAPGTYNIKVSVVNSAGLSAQATAVITVAAK